MLMAIVTSARPIAAFRCAHTGIPRRVRIVLGRWVLVSRSPGRTRRTTSWAPLVETAASGSPTPATQPTRREPCRRPLSADRGRMPSSCRVRRPQPCRRRGLRIVGRTDRQGSHPREAPSFPNGPPPEREPVMLPLVNHTRSGSLGRQHCAPSSRIPRSCTARGRVRGQGLPPLPPPAEQPLLGNSFDRRAPTIAMELTNMAADIRELPDPSPAGPEPVAQDSAGRDTHPSLGPVLRRARTHLQLSLREVERRIGRSNAYLSQVERGLIKHPDPSVLLELAELYGLNFTTLATWAGWTSTRNDTPRADPHDSVRVLVRHLLELDAAQQHRVLRYIENLRRERRT